MGPQARLGHAVSKTEVMIPRTLRGYAIDLASGMRKARSEGTDIATLTRRAGKPSRRPSPRSHSFNFGGSLVAVGEWQVESESCGQWPVNLFACRRGSEMPRFSIMYLPSFRGAQQSSRGLQAVAHGRVGF